MKKMSLDKAKVEKKRLKAQVKAEKAKAKAGQPSESFISPNLTQPEEKIKWYKDPNWVRALIAIVSLIIMVITLYITIVL